MKFPTVGQRIKLQRDVDRAHEFIAQSGLTGVVTLVNDGPQKAIHVRMDDPLTNGDNLIVWNDDGINDVSSEFWSDCQNA